MFTLTGINTGTMETPTAIPQALNALRSYYEKGTTRPLKFRLQQLQKLKDALRRYEEAITEALRLDLGKPAFESYASEIGFMYDEIRHAMRHLREWMEPEHKSVSWVHFPSSGRIISEPLGVVLIIGPWNYPLQLMLSPLVGAIAAGNCVALKPSDQTPHVAKLIYRMMEEIYEPAYIKTFPGPGSETVPALMNDFRFDHIFFTGSLPVGKKLAAEAAKTLTPVTLELGGKSPCIVGRGANLEVAARRIAWAKFFNAGQTCVCPDYLLIHHSEKEKFITLFKKYTLEFFGEDPKKSPDLGRIVNTKRMEILAGYLKQGKVLMGGTFDMQERYVAPTLLDQVSPDAPVMKEEIFGPILPLISFDTLGEVKEIVSRNPYPLSLYLFTADKKTEDYILGGISFGGGCINNTMIHLTSPEMPFGGVGFSGMGHYHGKYSFDTFSHRKSIVKTGTWLDFPVRYAPYRSKLALLKKLF